VVKEKIFFEEQTKYLIVIKEVFLIKHGFNLLRFCTK